MSGRKKQKGACSPSFGCSFFLKPLSVAETSCFSILERIREDAGLLEGTNYIFQYVKQSLKQSPAACHMDGRISTCRSMPSLPPPPAAS